MSIKGLGINKRLLRICFIMFAAITLFSCAREKGKLKVICNLPDTVSFNNNIMPIINAQCNTAGCHNGGYGGGNLNLSPSVAYSQLLRRGSGYVDTLNPEFSVLYGKLISASDFMPPTGRLDDCKIKLILQWMQQKAKNN